MERANKAILRTYRALLSQYKITRGEWPRIHSVVDAVLNHVCLPILGDCTPIRAHTGYKPKTPAHFVMWRGVELKKSSIVMASFSELLSICEQARGDLLAMHRDIISIRDHRRQQNANRKKTAHGIAFNVGDYVLVGRRTEKTTKLELHWQGPYVVTAITNRWVYTVNMIGDEFNTDEAYALEVHSSRIRLFADKDLNTTSTLVESAVHDLDWYEMKKILKYRTADESDNDLPTGTLEFLIEWLGFPKTEATWEPEAHLIADRKRFLLRYLRKNKSRPILNALVTRLEGKMIKRRKTKKSIAAGEGGEGGEDAS